MMGNKSADYNAALALYIQAKRAHHDISLRFLADVSGVSESTICRIENGEGCTIEDAMKIAMGFGMRPGDFFSEAFTLAESDERER